MIRTFRLIAAALALSLSACLGDEPVAPLIEETTFHQSLGVNLAGSTRTQTGLYYRDITIGTGALAQMRSLVSVDYVGYLTNGSSFDQGTVSFNVGLGDLQDMIPGFEEGALGMRVGGVRQLVIPPHLGYGPNRNGDIPGNSILVFNIELVSASGGGT